MEQPIDSPDKTFRMKVKLVSTDGEDLPFKGYALIPEDRLMHFEKLASAAQDLVAAQERAMKNAGQGFSAESAGKVLAERVRELAKLWDIPK